MPTYIAFAADGNENVYESDIKYYRLLMAWDKMKSKDFEFLNAHERSAAIRQGSKDETIRRTLRDRLNKSKRMLLLVGDTTRFDDDFVPYEIQYAIDSCKIPIIVVYVNQKNRILVDPNKPTSQELLDLLPQILRDRMKSGDAKTIHIPFRERIISRALDNFSINRMPNHSFGVFNDSIYNEIYNPWEI